MPAVITSLQNQRVKKTIRLRQGRQRQKQGRMIIDGVREVRQAMRAGIELVELFVCSRKHQHEAHRELLAQLTHLAVPLHEVTPSVMQRLEFGSRKDGVVAVARVPQKTLSQLQLPPHPLIVMLEGVEKPGNVGAVIRTADGAGADAIVICDGKTDLFNPNTIRSSLGTIFSMPIATATAAEAISWLSRMAARVLDARVDAPTSYAQADYTGTVAIALGSEATGLSSAWRGQNMTTVRLPMHGTVDSLNVSATAAVLLYEAQRQRKEEGKSTKDEGQRTKDERQRGS